MKNNKKTTEKQDDATKPALEADVERIRTATRQLLQELETALDKTKETDETQAKRNERLFGTKQPLVATLVTLAELLLKLDQVGAPMGEELSSPQLSPVDVALVQAFVAKMQAV